MKRAGWMRAAFGAARGAACVALFLGSLAGAQAQTESYPTRPVRVVVPFPPGGSVDTVARLVSPRLSESFGQQFVIENRSGASGNIGAEQVARAAPDGYTLMVHTLPLVANPYLYAKVPFDPLADFTPVSLLSSAATMLAIHPAVQAKSVRELIEFARAKPGTLNYSTAGAGTNPHIAAELFNQLAGISTVAIHFKGGGPGLLAALAGDTQIIFAGVSEAAPHVAAGKLRSLGITSPKRSGAFPDMATIAESGLSGYEFVTWHGLLGPKALPPALTARIGERVRRVMAAPEFVKVFQQSGLDIIASSPEDFGAYLKAESAKWGRVIRERNMRAE